MGTFDHLDSHKSELALDPVENISAQRQQNPFSNHNGCKTSSGHKCPYFPFWAQDFSSNKNLGNYRRSFLWIAFFYEMQIRTIFSIVVYYNILLINVERV